LEMRGMSDVPDETLESPGDRRTTCQIHLDEVVVSRQSVVVRKPARTFTSGLTSQALRAESRPSKGALPTEPGGSAPGGMGKQYQHSMRETTTSS